MTKTEFLALREIAERNGYGYIQQLMTGLWSLDYEKQGLPKYDVPVATLKNINKENRKSEIDIARYVAEEFYE